MAKISYLTPPCMLCRKTSILQIDEDCFRNWQGGMNIQRAFAHLPAPEREMIMTGTHPACWNTLTKDLEDPDEDDEPI